MQPWIRYASALAISLSSVPFPAFAAYTLNMTEGVTPLSREVYHLHMTILWICVAIGVVVFGVMFYAIWRHRKSVGHQAAQFHESTVVEIIWTIIPFLILIAMAIPATKVLLVMADTKNADITIKVTGHQWRWEYEYLGKDVKFFSNIKTPQDEIQNRMAKSEQYLSDVDRPLVLPVGKKVSFMTTSNDVIHSFWVPDLGMKKDAIPGFINEMWAKIETPGTYRGYCAELCGILHAFMPIVIEAVSPEDFEKWLTEQQKGSDHEHQ